MTRVTVLVCFFISNPSWPHRTRLKENLCNAHTIPQLLPFCQDIFHPAQSGQSVIDRVVIPSFLSTIAAGWSLLDHSGSFHFSFFICACPNAFPAPRSSSSSGAAREKFADGPAGYGDIHAVDSAAEAALCGEGYVPKVHYSGVRYTTGLQRGDTNTRGRTADLWKCRAQNRHKLPVSQQRMAELECLPWAMEVVAIQAVRPFPPWVETSPALKTVLPRSQASLFSLSCLS